MNKITIDAREDILGGQVATQSISGYRVESRGKTQATFIKGKPVKHWLHCVLTLCTWGLWGLVWILLIIFGGEKRKVVTVDEWGNITEV